MKISKFFLCMLGVGLAGSACAKEFSFDVSRTDESKGFGAINHQVVSLSGVQMGPASVQLRLEMKQQDATATDVQKTGSFGEAIINYPVNSTVYGMTRVGSADENRLFVKDSVYQEFGYKMGEISPKTFLDLNAGIGTRKFTTGREAFLSVGPSFSWAYSSLTLRREQSLDGGGYRHMIAGSTWLTPQFKVEGLYMSEDRKKFNVLGAAPGVADVKGNRSALTLTYAVNAKVNISAKFEKVSLEKTGVAGKYYDPSSVGLGLKTSF